MLEVYLYGDRESGWLDLSPDTSLEMEKMLDLFDQDLSAGEFSLPIEIPWTEGNRRKLNFAERIENFAQSKTYWQVDVYDSGFPELIRAKLTLLEKNGSFTYQKGFFTASISGTEGMFGSNLKNKKLRDVDLGGIINFGVEEDSRGFATRLMKVGIPDYNYIAFAPVAIEEFFDTSKSYSDEFIAKDTVNYIVYDPTGPEPNDWFFARPTAADETVGANAGTEEYIDYRTVPFLNFKYVLRKAFESLGYTVSGEIIDNTDFDHLYIFNNQSIDFFSPTVYLDYNRKIVPADHVPDILVVDFFRRIFSFFNVYPIVGATHVELRYRNRVFKDRKVFDITKFVNPDFTSSFQEVTTDKGYSLKYAWDANDSYHSDRVKDKATLSTKNLVARVDAFGDLATLDIGRPFTTDDMVYVVFENMYYVAADATSIPVKWDAWGESLEDYEQGDGERSVDLGLGTLCTYVELDEAEGLYKNRLRVGCRMAGSYWTKTFRQVKSPFDLSLFYIKKTVVDGKNIPVSFNHNVNPAGTVMENFSLALSTVQGIVPTFHSKWQAVQENTEVIKITINIDKRILMEIKAADILQIQNVLFLPRKIESSIPLEGTITMELVPL